MKVLNFGSLNIDNVYRVHEIASPEESISAISYSKFSGGKGLNQSIAFSNTGKTIYHAGMIGVGGDMLLEELDRNRVNTKYIKKSEEKCGHTIIQVDDNGQNCIICFPGSNHLIEKDYIDEVLDGFCSGDWMILQNEISNIDYIIEKAYERGMKIMLNVSPITQEVFKLNYDMVTVLMLNEIEGQSLCGIETEDRDILINALSQKYNQSQIVLTLGKNGVMYKYKEESYYQESIDAEIVDTTAAGDTFTGYFLYGLIENIGIAKALKLASIASSITISRKGAAISIPKIDEIDFF